MKILCIGDNITKGIPGCSYVALLQKANPDWTFVNAGVNGEPLLKISHRLFLKLEEGKVFDAVVLQAGYNDLLLTSFKKKGSFLSKLFADHTALGFKPIDHPLEYEIMLTAIIEKIRVLSNAIIILTTISCLGENLSSELNKKRRDYNTSIRKVALIYNCQVADVSYRFYEELKQNKKRDYFVCSFQNFSFLDQIFYKIPGGADFLSNRRGLSLTTDGMQLNSWGGSIFKEEIEKHLLLKEDILMSKPLNY